MCSSNNLMIQAFPQITIGHSLEFMFLEKNLNEAQQKELKETMEKLKADYLHKMIEQIEKQNIEYYNELACEYELQM